MNVLETDRTTIYCIFLLQWFPYWAKAKVPAKYCGIEFDQTSLQVATVLSLMPLLLWICFIAGTDCIIACPLPLEPYMWEGKGCAQKPWAVHMNSTQGFQHTERLARFILYFVTSVAHTKCILYFIKICWCRISARMRKQKFLACNYCTKIWLW